jgi:hypothetical protein
MRSMAQICSRKEFMFEELKLLCSPTRPAQGLGTSCGPACSCCFNARACIIERASGCLSGWHSGTSFVWASCSRHTVVRRECSEAWATCISLDGIVSDAVGGQEHQGLVGPAR